MNTPVKQVSRFNLSRNSAQKLAPLNHFKTQEKLFNEKEDMSNRTGISTVNNMPSINLKKIDKLESTGRFKEKQAHLPPLRQSTDANPELASIEISQSKPETQPAEVKPAEQETNNLDKFSDARLFEEIKRRMNNQTEFKQNLISNCLHKDDVKEEKN